MAKDMFELSVHFERIVRVADGATVAHELLLRPVEGGDLVDRATLADVTMEWITGFALRTAGAVLERSAVPLHVNVTPADLAHPRFVATILARVDRADLAHLVLEVTEQTPLVRSRQLETTLIELRRLGVRFAIDDLGDGWADERSIEIVRPEIIKVRLHHLRSRAGGDRAASIVALARQHDAHLVVEQVEQPADLELVRALGASHAQGWLWELDLSTADHGERCHPRSDGEPGQHRV